MKQFICLFFTVLCVSQSTNAQFTLNSNRSNADTVMIANLFDNSVGLKYSNFTGYGLSFSKIIYKDYSLHFCGVIEYIEHLSWEDMSKAKLTTNQKDITYNFGLEFRRNVVTYNYSNLYVLIGGYIDENKYSNTVDNDVVTHKFAVGIGVGAEWFLSSHVSGNFDLGYKFDNIEAVDYNKPSVTRKTGVGVGVGLQYHF
ncbi:MAG: hypothetical protein JST20_03655 [Bacteroidetes bacterium]|nr:hypothetical protein [Bacteroidota bacterium]